MECRPRAANWSAGCSACRQPAVEEPAVRKVGGFFIFRRALDLLRVGQHMRTMEIDPFVIPEESTAADAVAAIESDLDLFDDWMDRYGFIIDLGRKLPPFPEDWQDDAHRVPGCQSKVWMEAVVRDGRMFLAGGSDAAIVAGLVALLLRVYSGRSASEVLATPPEFLKEMGLLANLSSNRGSGIAAMAQRIREAAKAITVAAA